MLTSALIAFQLFVNVLTSGSDTTSNTSATNAAPQAAACKTYGGTGGWDDKE
jgi:hypothetical protein